MKAMKMEGRPSSKQNEKDSIKSAQIQAQNENCFLVDSLKKMKNEGEKLLNVWLIDTRYKSYVKVEKF